MTRRIRVGLALPVEHTAEDSISERFANLLEVARFADCAGFDTLYAPQHYLAAPSQYLHCIATLARVAAETRHVRLCTNIIQLTLQHPVDMAESLATLDVICGGRLVAGFGLGYNEREFAAFGVPRGARLRRFLEALTLIKRLWTEVGVTHQGEFFQLEDASLGIKPLTRPHPPIVIAASGDKMIARAAKLGDGLSLAGHSTLDGLRRQGQVYRAALAAQGIDRVPEHSRVVVESFVARDAATARALCLPHVARKYAAYAGMGQDSVLPPGQHFDSRIEELAKNRFVIGSPAQVADGLRRYAEALGVDEVGVRMHWMGLPHADMLRALELFAGAVIPQLRAG